MQFTTLTPDDLLRLYSYPSRLGAPWFRVNFIATVDGAVSLDGVSGPLGTPADHALFDIQRDLADVVLVGGGTARAENYGGAHTDAHRRIRLHHHGLGGAPDGSPPPIAVVTARADLDPAGRLFTDTVTPPIVLTTAAAPMERRERLTAAGAEVIVAGPDGMTPTAIRDALTARGLLRVLCEGGPSLFGRLLGAGLVDELCLTVSPLLAAGSAGRIAVSDNATPTPMSLRHVLLDSDGTMLTRWERQHTQS
ncbi:pyrimidine reductase family protein [Nocardia stercoris]|nr:pyrimidine reductase family protein [Nocardia stercoris]